ncbi:hypothetical protein EZV62_018569 [Acer yangbiense]|uniref:Uncharacterized protein n=1 Tax=Acer yangbiense TaxID=1000413 RepID=A0A5C7HLT5_9ROSI|nr:hypothetical protein EZV62_018569 [Acer yangbiense]
MVKGEEVREIRNDAELFYVLGEFEQRNVSQIHFNVNYIPPAAMSYYQSSNSENEESYNENNENGDEMHNANNDNGDENDGLSDVNEDGISQEVVVDIGSDSDNDVQRDPPNRGTAFRVGVDGRITLEVGQMFRVTKNRDANSVWLGKKFEAFIKENLDANIKVLGSAVLRFKVDYLTEQFWHAANSSNLPEFLEAMEAIKATSEAAYLYLTRIPLESWTVHKFDTIYKTDHNTNSVVEAFNSWLNKFRALLMLTLLERVRQKLMKRIHDRYEAAMRWESNIPPAVNRKA